VADATERLRKELQSAERELNITSCELCGGVLAAPYRVTPCRHALCALCAEGGALYYRQCVVCGTAIDAAPKADAGLKGLLEPHITPEVLTAHNDALAGAVKERKRTRRVVISFGNKLTKREGKCSIETFVKPLAAQGDKSGLEKNCVKLVEFNHNPSYPTSKEGRVSQMKGKLGFSFEYTMSRAYPCFITIHWDAALSLPPLHIPYETSDISSISRRLVVEFPPKGAATKRVPKGTIATFDCHGGHDDGPALNGWVIYGADSAQSAILGQRYVGMADNVQAVATPPAAEAPIKAALAMLTDAAERGVALNSVASLLAPDDHSLLAEFARNGTSKPYEELLTVLRPATSYVQVEGKSAQLRAAAAHEGGLSNSKSVPSSFFHVAIDCPGYGKSPGDCQTVRSYPSQTISAIIKALGKRHAYALVGSSQGACSVFNAVLEQPGLARFIAVRDPVGHDPSRYTAIQQAAYLLFDVDDPGHPVSVGRRMRSFLPRPNYYEHSSLQEPYYHELHMGEQMLEMFGKNPGADSGNSTKRPMLGKLAGGLNAWTKASGREFVEWED